jgi:CubicO group peptidase (beta-lactamase class C family)
MKHTTQSAAQPHTDLIRRRLLTGLFGATLWGWTGLPAAGATPAPRQLDAARLDQAVAKARRYDQLNSLIIARDGKIQFAEALRGPGLDGPVNIKSISKTLVATLTGVALDRGVLDSVEQQVAPFLNDLTAANADPRLNQITIDHLLTMRAGLERTSGPNYGRWVTSADWVRYAWNRPFVDQPGGRMLYSTGSYHLLAAVLTYATESNLLELARQWLGEPLAIQFPSWTRDPQGIYLGGNDMVLSPNALLRFGEMYRQGGVWRGNSVVSPEWIALAWTPRTYSPFSGDDYGYGWFINTVLGHPVRYARGYGGQLLYLVPDLGLTLVVTSDPTRPARSAGYFGALKTLADAIIAAAELS